MVRRCNIKGLNLTFVFRHRWEKDRMVKRTEFREYELGIWYKNTKCVGKHNFKNVREWKNNLCNSHMLGINLLICKFWIDIDYGVMHFKE